MPDLPGGGNFYFGMGPVFRCAGVWAGSVDCNGLSDAFFCHPNNTRKYKMEKQA